MALTRRALLEQIGKVGGAGATYMAMEALGLALPTSVGAENFQLPAVSGNGRSVVVLGAGIAGLVSAYELKRAGYRVTVLEARDRVGGRAWTIRGGDRIVQSGRPDQLATFDREQYFNPGPARIPSTHRVMLGYARRLGVPMEPFINTNRNAGWDFGGKVHSDRQMVMDVRGHIGELLAKAIDRHALDQDLPRAELDHLRGFLNGYASLNEAGVYTPDGRSGFDIEPGGYARFGVPRKPLPLSEALLPANGSIIPHVFETIEVMQPTLLQPVGGMDRIAHALFEQIKPAVRFNTPVTAIRRAGDGVRIEHGPGQQATHADYAVVTLPVPLLERVGNDFSPAKKAALKDVQYLKSVKVAFESPRFWETDDDIYGGLAWTDRLNENVLYPSSGFNAPRGVLVAAYVAGWMSDQDPLKFAALSNEERLRVCRESIEALHPGRSHLLSKGVSVAWGLVPWSEGVGAIGRDFDDSGPGVARGPRYLELLKPEGPIVFAGEHLSYVGLWQEGAALSAHEALKIVASMAKEGTGRAAAIG